jgi:uncharacterized oxidoreductase
VRRAAAGRRPPGEEEVERAKTQLRASLLTRFAPERLRAFAAACLSAYGCADATAASVADHLVEAEMRGFASHGVMRLSQYAEQARDGVFDPAGRPVLTQAAGGGALVDGGGGFGMPALDLAVDEAARQARRQTVGVCGVTNVGHTGCLGIIVECAARAGLFALTFGGGTRHITPQVAAHGGAGAVLPTNPYALAVPAGADGPVVVDFATAAASGGKVMAARAAGRPLPEGLIVDAAGAPTTDPNAYFAGGALLPMDGPRGFGLGLIAELIGMAISDKGLYGMTWIVVCVDLARFRGPGFDAAADALIADLRAVPPAPGSTGVEIPGVRERALRDRRRAEGVPIPPRIVEALNATAASLGVADL